MSIETLPLNLCKANIELQLRLSQLLREGAHRWLESVQQSSTEDIAEITAEIEGLSHSVTWQALATLPSEAFWRLFQHRVNDAQTINQIAVKNQAAFTTGLQQALESWQKSVAEVFDTANAPFPSQDIFKQWGAAWGSNTAVSPKAKQAGQGK